MNTVIEFMKSNTLCTLCLILGIIALLITYVGAPIASKRSGKLDYQFNVITKEKYATISECKSHAVPKTSNRLIDVNR